MEVNQKLLDIIQEAKIKKMWLHNKRFGQWFSPYELEEYVKHGRYSRFWAYELRNPEEYLAILDEQVAKDMQKIELIQNKINKERGIE